MHIGFALLNTFCWCLIRKRKNDRLEKISVSRPYSGGLNIFFTISYPAHIKMLKCQHVLVCTTAGNLQNMKPVKNCTYFIYCTFPAVVHIHVANSGLPFEPRHEISNNVSF